MVQLDEFQFYNAIYYKDYIKYYGLQDPSVLNFQNIDFKAIVIYLSDY